MARALRPRRRRLLRGAAVFLALVVLALVGVKARYGGGRPYPGVVTAPLVSADRVHVVVELPYPPGNVAVSRGGRVFFNTHPFVQSHRFTNAFLFEMRDGAPRPYPDLASQGDMAFVFGMTVDASERLWVVSPATLDRDRTRLMAFDLATGARVVDHWFAPGEARFAQDLRVSPDGRTLFFADTGAFRFTEPAILVVDATTFRTRRVLGGHPSTKPEDWTIRTAHGPHRIGYGLITWAVGVDGLAMSEDGAWLYYAPMSHDTLFRVPTRALGDEALSEAALEATVERVGPKPLSDGIAIAPDGAVLVTDVENGGLARLDASGKVETLVRRDGVVWADGVAVAPSGEILFTDSAIPSYLDPLLRPPAAEKLRAGAPYRIYGVRSAP